MLRIAHEMKYLLERLPENTLIAFLTYFPEEIRIAPLEGLSKDVPKNL
jgi:hypothetical protein